MFRNSIDINRGLVHHHPNNLRQVRLPEQGRGGGARYPERHFGDDIFRERSNLRLRGLPIPIMREAAHVARTLNNPAFVDRLLEAAHGGRGIPQRSIGHIRHGSGNTPPLLAFLFPGATTAIVLPVDELRDFRQVESMYESIS